MKKALMVVSILLIAVISTACINNIAVQELNNKAAEFMAKGDYESAMNRLQASLDLDATMYQTYYNLGVAAINANKYDKAVEALEDGIKIQPDFAEFYYSLGVAKIGLADDILENANIKGEANSYSETGNVELKRDITLEEKANAFELKKSATENLKKYLELLPDSKDKAVVEEMIKQCEEFVSTENKKEA